MIICHVCLCGLSRALYCKIALTLSLNIKNHFTRILNQQPGHTKQVVQIRLPYNMPPHMRFNRHCTDSCYAVLHDCEDFLLTLLVSKQASAKHLSKRNYKRFRSASNDTNDTQDTPHSGGEAEEVDIEDEEGEAPAYSTGREKRICTRRRFVNNLYSAYLEANDPLTAEDLDGKAVRRSASLNSAADGAAEEGNNNPILDTVVGVEKKTTKRRYSNMASSQLRREAEQRNQSNREQFYGASHRLISSGGFQVGTAGPTLPLLPPKRKRGRPLKESANSSVASSSLQSVEVDHSGRVAKGGWKASKAAVPVSSHHTKKNGAAAKKHSLFVPHDHISSQTQTSQQPPCYGEDLQPSHYLQQQQRGEMDREGVEAEEDGFDYNDMSILGELTVTSFWCFLFQC